MSTNKKEVKTLAEIEELSKEPEFDILEKFATISDDQQSLLLRIPQEIRNHFAIKAGDKIRFYTEFRPKQTPELKISWVKKNDIR